MAEDQAKEKEELVDTSITDLEVAQALIAEPTYKLDSKPSLYKVCVSLISFPISMHSLTLILACLQGGMVEWDVRWMFAAPSENFQSAQFLCIRLHPPKHSVATPLDLSAGDVVTLDTLHGYFMVYRFLRLYSCGK